jgi:hypothetical protein
MVSTNVDTQSQNSLLILLNLALDQGVTAASWAESIVVSIPKKRDLTLLDNYRGISLMPTTLKVLCSIIAQRINKVAEAEGLFHQVQAGFRTAEDCVLQAACLTEIIQW